MKTNGDWAWETVSKQIFVPDVRLEGLPLRGIYEFVPMRGWGYTLAVRSRVNGSVIGFVIAEDYGFKNAREFVDALKDGDV